METIRNLFARARVSTVSITALACAVSTALSLEIGSHQAFSANRSLPTSLKAKSTTDADPQLLAMQQKYEHVKTLVAEFSQLQKNAASGRDKESKGRIYIMRPDKFRWETLEPDASILCGNGRKVWYYTAPFREGEKGQVMIRNAQDAQSKLAVELLVGGVEFRKSFDSRRVEPLHYRLHPLKAAGDVDHIELFLENQTNLVYKVQLVSVSGNETTLTLKNVELGAKLSESMFTFQVPAHTEVVQ